MARLIARNRKTRADTTLARDAKDGGDNFFVSMLAPDGVTFKITSDGRRDFYLTVTADEFRHAKERFERYAHATTKG